MAYWRFTMETMRGRVCVEFGKFFLHGFPLCGLQLNNSALAAGCVVLYNDIAGGFASATA
jgi:hypothetical protein